MQDYITYAKRQGIELLTEGPCQFCGAGLSGGVFECHENIHHLLKFLDYSNPHHYETRFLSVDAMALQHCEVHGPWNNHIHLTRLYLIFEHQIKWDYKKTPQLSNIINKYKKDKSETLTAPPPQQRGRITTVDLLEAKSEAEAIATVKLWAEGVFSAFNSHHPLVSTIARMYLDNYY